jgi:hypothetical protein
MLVCVLFCALLHTRPRVQRAPGVPCALRSEGKEFLAKLGRIAPRDREGVSAAYLVIPAKAGIQYSREVKIKSSGRGVLDRPVIGERKRRRPLDGYAGR